MQPPDGTGTVTFAVTKIYLGDTDPDGTPDMADGWKHYGYNLDGVPAGNLAAFCQPVTGATAATVHTEGINGIENAFGHLILPTILGINANAPTTIDQDLQGGLFTILLSLDQLGMGNSYNPVPSHFAAGGPLGSTPRFDGTDVWPVVQGTDVDLPAAYLTSNTWVSGAKTSITVSLPLMGLMLDLHLRAAVLSMNLDAAHQKVKGGILAGVLSTTEFLAQVRALAGGISTAFCSGPLIDSILLSIQQASDIMQDGTQDPTRTCDGISIGLGFDAAVVQLGATVPAVTQPDPCGG
jgi:hypothetical protein